MHKYFILKIPTFEIFYIFIQFFLLVLIKNYAKIDTKNNKYYKIQKLI